MHSPILLGKLQARQNLFARETARPKRDRLFRLLRLKTAPLPYDQIGGEFDCIKEEIEMSMLKKVQ
jgi:hypothetical protein